MVYSEHDLFSDIIQGIVLCQEAEAAWELMCMHFKLTQKEKYLELFQEEDMPSRQANVLADGGLEVFVCGKGGKLVIQIPPEGWSYRTLH
jgi:hypothetical protein